LARKGCPGGGWPCTGVVCFDDAAPLNDREGEQHQIEREKERETRLELEHKPSCRQHVTNYLVEVGLVRLKRFGDTRQLGEPAAVAKEREERRSKKLTAAQRRVEGRDHLLQVPCHHYRDDVDGGGDEGRYPVPELRAQCGAQRRRQPPGLGSLGVG